MTTFDILVDGADLLSAVHKSSVPGLDIVPGNSDLSSADMALVDDPGRTTKLRKALEKARADGSAYDYILIDCPPSLNLLTINAMVAANDVLVPLQCEFFALEGLSQLMMSIREVRANLNPGLTIQGVVLTMYDGRNNLSKQVEEDVRSNLGSLVYDTIIPRNIRLSEAPSFAMPALIYDHRSSGSIAYQKLAAELLRRMNDTVTV